MPAFRGRPSRAPAERPPPFGIDGPDEAFVEKAREYLDALEPRDRQRLEHAFENRQDALLGYLDEQGLTDDGYACARQLLFELFSMIELGWPPGVGSTTLGLAGAKRGNGEVPAALVSCVARAPSEARDAVMRGLEALWSARKPKR